MRAVAVLLLSCLSGSFAYADPQPIAKLAAPEGRFFDDPVALSADGKSVALVSTDAASPSTLHLWTPETSTELKAGGLFATVTALSFLAPGRVLIVGKHEGDERLVGAIANAKNGALTIEKTHLGPADAIDVIERDGKRAIAIYRRVSHKTTTHEIELVSAETGKSLGRRSIAEDAEGLLRTHAGTVRPLWWSRGHTELAAQKIGEYDKARDMRRPDRFVRIDVVSNKSLVEQEISDVLGFAKVVLSHRASPADEAFSHLSEDHKEVLLVDGLYERPLPLARAINLYEPESLRSEVLDDKTLLIGFQVDANNIVAVGRRAQDPDDLDLYAVDRASLAQPTVAARRILTLPGQGRPARFTAVAGRVAILRKGKGFDRGGVTIELYALP